jgi:hypothetical protein
MRIGDRTGSLAIPPECHRANWLWDCWHLSKISVSKETGVSSWLWRPVGHDDGLPSLSRETSGWERLVDRRAEGHASDLDGRPATFQARDGGAQFHKRRLPINEAIELWRGPSA